MGARCISGAALALAGALAAGPAFAVEIRGKVLDARTGRPLAARIYVRGEDGAWRFARSASPEGSAVRYEKRNWVNPDAVEMHTTVSAHPFAVEAPPGRAEIVVERGKEYFPERLEVALSSEPVDVEVRLRRWVDMAARGWYSGETHLHRTLDELRNVAIAEDLNVSLPISHWVTRASSPPASGDRNVGGDVPEGLVALDATHVVWARNSEYEIFTVGDRPHTLGSLIAIGHRAALEAGAPPWRPAAEAALARGALLEIEKFDWSVSPLFPHLGARLYELANNHVWRTEFGFRDWVSEAPPTLLPPYGGKRGGEREWVLYTLGMYYALLDSGFRLAPSAGTASGVHPVPAGFSRVYVHLPGGFDYGAWMEGLAAGRSFVTTGPMIFATAEARDPGETFRSEGGALKLRLAGTILSEAPLAFAEAIQDGEPAWTIFPENRRTEEGAFETRFSGELLFERSGWAALRAWEDRPGGRFRFAHTGPWFAEIRGKPLRPRAEERGFLARRMRDEIERSREVLPREALEEYESALAAYERIEPRADGDEIARTARRPAGEADFRHELEEMVRHHGFTPFEVRKATGLPLDEIDSALRRFGIAGAPPPPRGPDAPLLVLPYPGGRHPRAGFLDGAVDPQRDTKASVFLPWDSGGYVVADVPEAIFSDRGLLYLAHTHVPTVWSERGAALERLEWRRLPDGSLESERTLPDGVAFGSRVAPSRDSVRMELWLRNGSEETLRGLRVQNCVHLKAARGFSAQTNANKVFSPPYAAVRSEDGRRWTIVAWDPADRLWANPAVPCVHSDPKFPDCPPGETRRIRGWLSFYEGSDLEAELRRIDAAGWRKP